MYDYDELQRDFARYRRFAKVGTIGVTSEGRRIPYVFVGEMGKKQIIVQGGIHAREHITGALVSVLVDYCLSVKRPEGMGVWFLPLVNIDGAELAIHGLSSISCPKRQEFLRRVNGGSEDFSLWKANAEGVDLNNNFNARWGRGEGQVVCPAPHGYIGCRPHSAPEARALGRFTSLIKPRATISYHCKGEVIYWDFHEQGKALERDRAIAENLSACTGYSLESTGNSTGGYKDWCIEKLGITAFTIEAGSDSYRHPLPYAALDTMYKQNKNVIEVLGECL